MTYQELLTRVAVVGYYDPTKYKTVRDIVLDIKLCHNPAAADALLLKCTEHMLEYVEDNVKKESE